MHGPLPGRPAAYYAAFVSRFPVYPRLAFAQSTVNDQNRRAPTCVLREIDRLRVHVNENALHFLAGRYHFSPQRKWFVRDLDVEKNSHSFLRLIDHGNSDHCELA